MAIVDAAIRVHHPCPYCDVSVAFPRTLLLLWCDNRRDIFLVSAPDRAELGEVTRILRRRFHARPLLSEGRLEVLELPDFEWKSPPSVTGIARRFRVWVMHPVLYLDGAETYRFVAPSRAILSRMVTRLRRMGDVELLAVSERAGLEPSRDQATASVHLLEGLTDSQARSLVAAYDGGLLNVPARGSWSAVAARVGLSRSTFGEHLRKGQLRLLKNSYAALKVRAGALERPIFLPALGKSSAARRAHKVGR